MEIIPIVNENDQQIGSIDKAKFDKTKGDISHSSGNFSRFF